MFYNTGIATYIWVLTNRKPKHRLDKVQFAASRLGPLRADLERRAERMEQVREIDGEQAYEKMRRAVVQASQVEKASPQPPNPLERSGGRRSRLTDCLDGHPSPSARPDGNTRPGAA